MSLFKTGDSIHDEYANLSTEQLIKIVTDTEGFYTEGAVSAARKILLTRGLDYRTKEQKKAEKEVEAIIGERQWREQQTPRVRLNRPASGNTGLKWWQWIWIVVILVRIIGCLIKKSH
jgi:hypothetical protein